MNLERARGYKDARAGHGPSSFDGQYMVGYRRGRAEIGLPMEHQPTEDAAANLSMAVPCFEKCGDWVATPWHLLRTMDTLTKALRPLNWIMSVIKPRQEGAPHAFAPICMACAKKVHPPEVIEAWKKSGET